MRLVTGRLQVNPRGFGFVTPERPVSGLAGDLYIAGHGLGPALHGDRVVARVERQRDAGRAEGSIVRVVERATSRLVGRFEGGVRGAAFVVPFDRRIVADVRIPGPAVGGAVPGEMVEVELTAWPTAAGAPAGRVTEVLGDSEAPGVDTRIMIRKHGLPDAHEDDAIAEARRLGFQGKLCIHPKQVAPVNRVFSPDAGAVAQAEKHVAAFREAEAAGSASIQVDGYFIDYPIYEKAARVLRIAEAIRQKDAQAG